MVRSSLIALGLGLGLLLPAAACSQGPCEATCRHVAACKRERVIGERFPGDSVPPADPTCLARCAAATPEYGACEGKKRECAAVLECINYR